MTLHDDDYLFFLWLGFLVYAMVGTIYGIQNPTNFRTAYGGSSDLFPVPQTIADSLAYLRGQLLVLATVLSGSILAWVGLRR